MTLLQKRDQARRARRLALYEETREKLRGALEELLPGEKVITFGSLTQPGRFHDASDIDLALEREPEGISHYALSSELEERLGRRVDVVLLPRCRFHAKILAKGEVWTR